MESFPKQQRSVYDPDLPEDQPLVNTARRKYQKCGSREVATERIAPAVPLDDARRCRLCAVGKTESRLPLFVMLHRQNSLVASPRLREHRKVTSEGVINVATFQKLTNDGLEDRQRMVT